MNSARVGWMVAGGLLVLIVGIVVGTRLVQPAAAPLPPPLATPLPTTPPTDTPAPTAIPIHPPAGLGTHYYESDTGDTGDVDLRAVGHAIVVDVTTGIYGHQVYTGTVAGQTFSGTAPAADSAPFGAHRTLVIRVTQPGHAAVTGTDPGSSGTDMWRFPATCGHREDATLYLTCHPFVAPPPLPTPRPSRVPHGLQRWYVTEGQSALGAGRLIHLERRDAHVIVHLSPSQDTATILSVVQQAQSGTWPAETDILTGTIRGDTVTAKGAVSVASYQKAITIRAQPQGQARVSLQLFNVYEHKVQPNGGPEEGAATCQYNGDQSYAVCHDLTGP